MSDCCVSGTTLTSTASEVSIVSSTSGMSECRFFFFLIFGVTSSVSISGGFVDELSLQGTEIGIIIEQAGRLDHNLHRN
jgi:hypothetical protein